MININSVLVISISALAFFSFCFFVVFVPIALQLSRTLNSAQHLIDTINDDLEPTLKEVKHSVDDVKNVVQKTTNTLKDSLSKVRMVILSSAYGILTGFKDYLSSCKTSEGSYNDNGRGRNRETATGR